MHKTLTLLFFLLTFHVYGQKVPAEIIQPILKEGTLLYYSERASINGFVDFFDKKCKQDHVEDYFSYSENGIHRCIFYSKSKLKVMVSFSYDSTFNNKKCKIDSVERDFTPLEHTLFEMRKNAGKEISSNPFFTIYKNTRVLLIPLIIGNERKVYMLTRPEDIGYILFGNDYLITMDSLNQVVQKKKLHEEITQFEYKTQPIDTKLSEITKHMHPGDTDGMITATDVATLMYFAESAKWKAHNVISKKYLSIWETSTKKFVVIYTDPAEMMKQKLPPTK